VASTKSIRILYYMGRKKKGTSPKFKVGDKVTSQEYSESRVFELVWYKEGDHTCAIQDDCLRAVVKVWGLVPHIEVDEQ